MKKIKLNLIELTCILLFAGCFMFCCIQQAQIQSLKQDMLYMKALEDEMVSKTAQMQVVNDKYDSIISFLTDYQNYKKHEIDKIEKWKNKK